MHARRAWPSPGATLLILMALGLAPRLVIAWQPLDLLVTTVLPDDGFMYFQLARRLASLGLVTFDGITPTNGFHPLWLVLLYPIYRLTPDPNLAIHLALTVSALLGTSVAAPVYALTLRLTASRLAAFGAALVYLCNPYTVLNTMNGMETALSLALVATLLLLAGQLPPDHSWRWALAFGLASGLTFLARTDNALLLALVFGLLALWRRRAAYANLLVAGSVAAALAVPWFGWSYLTTGAFFQSSGTAVTEVVRDNLVARDGPEGPAIRRDTVALPVALALIRDESALSGVWLPATLLLALTLVARWRRAPAASLDLLLLAALAMFIGALVGVHAIVRLYPRVWYFAPVGLLVALLCGLVIAEAQRLRRVGAGLALGVVLAISLLAVSEALLLAQRPRLPWQAEMQAAGRWVNANLPADVRVGAFNAGLIAYYAPRHTVMNLDGLMNQAALQAIRQRTLRAYLDEARIGYLVDYEAFFWSLDYPYSYARRWSTAPGAAGPANVQELTRLPGSYAGSDLVVLRVSGPPVAGRQALARATGQFDAPSAARQFVPHTLLLLRGVDAYSSLAASPPDYCMHQPFCVVLSEAGVTDHGMVRPA